MEISQLRPSLSPHRRTDPSGSRPHAAGTGTASLLVDRKPDRDRPARLRGCSMAATTILHAVGKQTHGKGPLTTIPVPLSNSPDGCIPFVAAVLTLLTALCAVTSAGAQTEPPGSGGSSQGTTNAPAAQPQPTPEAPARAPRAARPQPVRRP